LQRRNKISGVGFNSEDKFMPATMLGKRIAKLWTQLLILAALVLSSTASHATTLTFSSVLGPEAAGATGSGTVTLVYDDQSLLLAIAADWTGLSGVTTVAHIHCCTAAPGTVGVAVTPGTLPGFPVGVSTGSYDQTLNLDDPANFTAAFVTNFGAALLCGIAVLVMYFVALLPAGIGMFIALPLMAICNYTSYKAVFATDPPQPGFTSDAA
jgi:hypothetical protein